MFSLRRNRVLIFSLIFVFLFVLLTDTAQAAQDEPVLKNFRGLVLAVEEADDNPLGDSGYQSEAFNIEIRVLSGPLRDEVISVFHITGGNPSYDIFVQPGDKVLLEAEMDGDVPGEIYIADHLRENSVMLLVGLFVLMVLLLGGKSGFRALFSLLVTLVLVAQVFLPMLLKGYSPLPLASILSVLAIIVTMIVVGGLNRKTLAAIFGTAGGVLVAGVLALVFGNMAKLTGLSHEETQMLMYIPQGIAFNYKGLLFAGIMIGALGAVMDVGMSVSSSMFEVRRVSPGISTGDLLKSGMNVGRDIMGTMTNTLILAYLGSSTPLLLLFYAYEVSVFRILNLDSIVTELVRAFSGSIGLVAAIPLTALAAALLARPEGALQQSGAAGVDV